MAHYTILVTKMKKSWNLTKATTITSTTFLPSRTISQWLSLTFFITSTTTSI